MKQPAMTMIEGTIIFTILVCLALAVLAATTDVADDEPNTEWHPMDLTKTYKACLDGVQYHYLRRGHGLGLAPAINPDGSLQLCEENDNDR